MPAHRIPSCYCAYAYWHRVCREYPHTLAFWHRVAQSHPDDHLCLGLQRTMRYRAKLFRASLRKGEAALVPGTKPSRVPAVLRAVLLVFFACLITFRLSSVLILSPRKPRVQVTQVRKPNTVHRYLLTYLNSGLQRIESQAKSPPPKLPARASVQQHYPTASPLISTWRFHYSSLPRKATEVAKLYPTRAGPHLSEEIPASLLLTDTKRPLSALSVPQSIATTVPHLSLHDSRGDTHFLRYSSYQRTQPTAPTPPLIGNVPVFYCLTYQDWRPRNLLAAPPDNPPEPVNSPLRNLSYERDQVPRRAWPATSSTQVTASTSTNASQEVSTTTSGLHRPRNGHRGLSDGTHLPRYHRSVHGDHTDLCSLQQSNRDFSCRRTCH